ncbi:MAG: hypothetical protein AAF517_23420 [Planctomycetota bacterium]
MRPLSIFALCLTLASCASTTPFEVRFENVGPDPGWGTMSFDGVKWNFDPQAMRSRQSLALVDLDSSLQKLSQGASKSDVFDTLGDPSLYSSTRWIYLDLSDRGIPQASEEGLRYVEVLFEDGQYTAGHVSTMPMGAGAG